MALDGVESSMLVGIHQPHYLPWLRYFEKIDTCDVFILLDTVQYAKNGWQNRNKIKTAQGEFVLTVPVHAHLSDRILDVTIDTSQPWQSRHAKAIAQSYRGAPYFDFAIACLNDAFEMSWRSLAELNRHLIGRIMVALGISTPIRIASELNVTGEATERLVNLVKAVGGTEYYSGAYALESYLDADRLAREGIGLRLQRWNPPVYPQRHGTFISDLSIVDLLMNAGPESLAHLRKGGGRDV